MLKGAILFKVKLFKQSNNLAFFERQFFFHIFLSNINLKFYEQVNIIKDMNFKRNKKIYYRLLFKKVMFRSYKI